MYFIESLQYPFRGQGAFGKIVTAGLLLFIPLVNFFGMFVIAGYGIKIIGNVLAGDRDLPEFDIMQDFGRGLIALVAGFLYALPLIIVFAVFGALFGGDGAAGLGGVLISILSIPFSFVLSLVMIVAFSRYAVSEETSVLFDFGENIRLATSNLSAGLEFFVNALVYGFVAGILIGLGFMLLIIPGLVLMIATQFGQFHLYAMYAQRVGIGGKAKRKVQDYSFDF